MVGAVIHERKYSEDEGGYPYSAHCCLDAYQSEMCSVKGGQAGSHGLMDNHNCEEEQRGSSADRLHESN